MLRCGRGIKSSSPSASPSQSQSESLPVSESPKKTRKFHVFSCTIKALILGESDRGGSGTGTRYLQLLINGFASAAYRAARIGIVLVLVIEKGQEMAREHRQDTRNKINKNFVFIYTNNQQ